MMICRSRRFVFIHIHKAGGTSLELGLEPFMTWEDLLLGSSVLGEHMNRQFRDRFGLGKHSSLRDVERVCGTATIAEYYVFALVRHPVDRIVSLYNFVGTLVLNWCADNSVSLEALQQNLQEFAPKADVLRWPAARAFILTNSFSDFLRHRILHEDPAFHPQSERLSSANGKIAADVFKLEERNIWMPGLQEKLGIPFEFPHANESKQKLIRISELSAEDRTFMHNFFASDFRNFDYKYDINSKFG